MVSESCHDMRATEKKCLLVNKHPEIGSYRKEYYSLLSKYRRFCKIEEKNIRPKSMIKYPIT